MGKINSRMRKSRASITNEPNDISHTGTLSAAPGAVWTHAHEWHFAKDYADGYTGYSKFACLCGAVKRVKQFEVED